MSTLPPLHAAAALEPELAPVAVVQALKAHTLANARTLAEAFAKRVENVTILEIPKLNDRHAELPKAAIKRNLQNRYSVVLVSF